MSPQPFNPFPPGPAPNNPSPPYNPFSAATPSNFTSTGGYPPSPPSTVYSANASSVYQQIEGSANYYQPNVYELLTFYGSLSTQSDELDGQFIPLTDVQPTTAQQTLIFVVGVLAPSSNVVPNAILDRGATIASATSGVFSGQPQPPLNAANADPTTGQERSTAAPIPGSAGPTTTTSTNGMTQFVAMCNRLGCQPEQLAQVIQAESGFNPAAQNTGGVPGGPVFATGLIQISGVGPNGGYAGSTAAGLGLTQDQYQNFNQLSIAQQIPYIEKYYNMTAGVKGATAAQIYALNANPSGLNPDGTVYNSSLPGQAAAVKGNAIYATTNADGAQVVTPESLAAAVTRNPLPPNIQAGIDAARQELGMSNPQGTVTPSAGAATQYQSLGSTNANAAMQAISTYANTNLNTSNLGQQFMLAQQYEINATLAAIQRMQNTPPLKMLVNPQSFKLSAEKIVTDSEWSRNGPIVEHWGEQLDKIEASGKVAAFYSVDQSAVSTVPGVGPGPGLTRTARQYSSSYQNFLSLWLLYKNNGGIWLADFINSSSTQTSNLSVLGSIYIYYDNILYIGSFDSFNLTESETAPFTLEYNFSFTVRATFLLDNTDDLSLSLASLAESQNNSVLNQPTAVQTTTGVQNQQPAGAVSFFDQAHQTAGNL